MKRDEIISQEYKPVNIKEVTKKINISDNDIYEYGKHICKVSNYVKGNKDGKLILVTSTSPNKSGIGKTTVTIGLNDALNKNHTSIACIREPSLGPVFGNKGGASGGGYSQAYPLQDINLDFTGDFHVVTSINNLISATIDNELFQGNDINLDINSITFKRAIDMNDRALRHIDVSTNSEYKRPENFKLTAASEIMAILCLSNNIDDFLDKVNNVTIGKNLNGEKLYVSDLKITGSIAALSRKLLNPNLVQSLRGNPVFIHGGPFANIAHGTNTVMATKMALSLSDYVITEAGFGSDMGAEKFMNLVSQTNGFNPHAIVLVTTINSLKEYCENGTLSVGIINLKKHIFHLKNYNTNLVVSLNKHLGDLDVDVNLIKDVCEELEVKFTINNYYSQENIDEVDELSTVINSFSKSPDINFIYNLEDSLDVKLNKLINKVYGIKKFELSEECISKFNEIKDNTKYQKYPLCITKNPLTFSGDINDKFKEVIDKIVITDIEVYTGAKFILIYVNKILTLPGLSKDANVYKIQYDSKTGNVIGID